jgi:transcriptional regulator with XRE-family HTH domain
MFNQKRIDIFELEKLLAEGKSQSECARLLGVSKQAISKALQRKRNMGLPAKSTPEKFSEDRLGAFRKLMGNVLSEVRYLNNALKTVPPEERERLNMQRLKYIAEARKEFELALEIDSRRFNIEEVLKFRDYVIERIGECDAETREKIVAGLKRGNALRRLVSPS